mmetsp:Transcript_9038/g.18775  ORF Transcript_9038/g.18775 Transcript_9038/m.18775 type:complete len:358 (-) Transcript_9038:477-1550(-)
MGNQQSRTAESLKKQGNIALNHGQYRTALQFYTETLSRLDEEEKEMKERQALLPEQNVQYEGVKPDSADLKSSATVAVPATTAVSSQAEEWRNHKTETLDNMTQAHWRLSELDQAMICGTQALEIKNQYSPGSLEVAKTLNALGSIHCEKGEYDEAYSLLETAIQIHEAVPPPHPDPVKLATAYTNFAVLLGKMGQEATATIHWHKKSCAIKEDLYQKDQARYSTSLATSYLILAGQGTDFNQRLDYIQKARVVCNQMRPSPPHHLLTHLECTWGNLLCNCRKHKEAIPHYEKAAALELAACGSQTLPMADIYDCLADAWSEVGPQETARDYKTKALTIRNQLQPSALEAQVNKKKG